MKFIFIKKFFLSLNFSETVEILLKKLEIKAQGRKKAECIRDTRAFFPDAATQSSGFFSRAYVDFSETVEILLKKLEIKAQGRKKAECIRDTRAFFPDAATQSSGFFSRILLGIIFSCLLQSSASYGGMLFTLGPNWNNFVFESQAKEDTPNYYGYGGRTSFGYSFGQIFDLALYGHYSPGRLESASATDADAIIYDFGLETGFRILNVMYLGARGGSWNYRLSHKTTDDEIPGVWSGTGGEISVGLLFPVSKQVSWQMTMDVGQGLLDKQKKEATESDLKPRKFSRVSVTISFAYNAYMSDAIDSALFNSFMKTFF